MIAKVLVAVFLAVALMDQSSAVPFGMGVCFKPQLGDISSAAKDQLKCMIVGEEIFNERGEFDVKKVDKETIVRYLGSKTCDEVMAVLKACAAKMTDESREKKMRHFRKCVTTIE